MIGWLRRLIGSGQRSPRPARRGITPATESAIPRDAARGLGRMYTGVLRADEVLQVGGWSISYADGQLCLSYARGDVVVRLAPASPDAAAFTVRSDGTILPRKRPVRDAQGCQSLGSCVPLVMQGQGDYAGPWAPDLIEDNRARPISSRMT